MTRGTSGKSRQQIIDCLASGPISDSSGRATHILKERSGYEGGLTGLSALLLAMEQANLIRRTTKGKRCFEIALSKEGNFVEDLTFRSKDVPKHLTNLSATNNSTFSIPEIPPAGLVEIPPAPVPAQTSSPPAAPQAPQSVNQGFDASKIAEALLERVIGLAGTPDRQAREIQALQVRVHELTEHSERWRSRVRLVEDELIAYKEENRGLRMRLGEVERNLQAVLSSANSGIRLDPVRERELRELILLMKAPSSAR